MSRKQYGELVHLSVWLLIRRKFYNFRIMILPLTLATIASAIAVLTFSLSLILNIRTNRDREKSSAFECGFDPKNTARIPFSIRFFLLAIIFIVFDVEIVLLLPIPLLPTILNTPAAITAILIFLLILLIGLIHEWKEGSLDWSK